MPRKTPTPPLPSHHCSGTWIDPYDPNHEIRCEAMVASRKPSESGRHFCSGPRCQTAKQRFYRQRRADLLVKSSGDLFVDFLYDALYRERTNCAYCGAQNVLPGWGHRASVGGRACLMLGQRGPGLPERAIDIAFPDRAPDADGQ